jgi:hypothetical protein
MNIASYEQSHHNLPLAIDYYKRVLPQAWNSEQKTMVLTNMALIYRQMGDYASANECLTKQSALPQRKVDWQGSWWKQIIPMIKDALHIGGGNS